MTIVINVTTKSRTENFRGANKHASYHTAGGHVVHGLSQPQRSHLYGLCSRNRISDEQEIGKMAEERYDGGENDMMEGAERATGILTHWTKQSARTCYFTSVFCDSVVSHRSRRPIFMLQQS
ncbi:hypothetical protein EVAR_50079_1 [Eumeta japonica]|uniref:Uncharacterized protein n=1 Tax=Eumeta variegata TaxID=151549 RepID=A0A4C1ZNN0_EUMVA|nr:hypothetical protein EVAR_50079_1 [Eumeta japonica]